MLGRQSTTTPTPTTTNGHPALSDLIESAREKTRIAARIAESFENPSEVSFRDLDLISCNCYAANRSLEAAGRTLWSSDSSACTPMNLKPEQAKVQMYWCHLPRIKHERRPVNHSRMNVKGWGEN